MSQIPLAPGLSLADLAPGEAWFWSTGGRPGWPDVFRKVKVSPLDSFDSSSTPTLPCSAPRRAGNGP